MNSIKIDEDFRFKTKNFDIPTRLKSFTLELERNLPVFLRRFLADAFFFGLTFISQKKLMEREGKHVNQKEEKLIY